MEYLIGINKILYNHDCITLVFENTLCVIDLRINFIKSKKIYNVVLNMVKTLDNLIAPGHLCFLRFVIDER